MKIRDMVDSRELMELQTLCQMKQERNNLIAELKRMDGRMDVLNRRRVRNEERRMRFVKRLEAEIRRSRERLDMLEANIAGMEAEG